MDVKASTISAQEIDFSTWPMRPLGRLEGSRQAGFQVVFGSRVLDEMHRHGQSDLSVEVGGVLVGLCCRDEMGPYVLVEAAIAGIATRGQSTQVTFTAETWQHIQQVMDREHPHSKMLGWYHTHPGFGIFLSDMDLFIHGNFFNLPWQIAFVYDPKAHSQGLFVWKQGKTENQPWLVEHAAVENKTPSGTHSSAAPQSGVFAESTEGKATLLQDPQFVVDLLYRIHRLERRVRWLFIAIAFVMAFAAAWAWVTTPSSQPASRSATTQSSGVVVPSASVPATQSAKKEH